MHPLYGALSLPYVPVQVSRGALVAHRYTYVTPRFGASQYRRTFILLSVYLWNNLLTLYSMVGDCRVLIKSWADAFLLT